MKITSELKINSESHFLIWNTQHEIFNPFENALPLSKQQHQVWNTKTIIVLTASRQKSVNQN